MNAAARALDKQSEPLVDSVFRNLSPGMDYSYRAVRNTATASDQLNLHTLSATTQRFVSVLLSNIAPHNKLQRMSVALVAIAPVRTSQFRG